MEKKILKFKKTILIVNKVDDIYLCDEVDLDNTDDLRKQDAST